MPEMYMSALCKKVLNNNQIGDSAYVDDSVIAD